MKVLITCILFYASLCLQAQENKITVSPPQMTATSAFTIKMEKSGVHVLKILDEDQNVLFKKDIQPNDKNLVVFKHNFTAYKKGTYTFQLIRKNKVVFETKQKKELK